MAGLAASAVPCAREGVLHSCTAVGTCTHDAALEERRTTDRRHARRRRSARQGTYFIIRGRIRVDTMVCTRCLFSHNHNHNFLVCFFVFGEAKQGASRAEVRPIRVC